MSDSKLQFKIKKKCLFTITLILVFLAFNHNKVEAAKFNLISLADTIRVGQQFQVDLLLNTEDEDINAIEGALWFPADLVEVKEIRDGSSVINFWIKKPSLLSQSQIIYSGIIPGGFNDKKGLIFSVVFKTIKEGVSTIEIYDAKVLLNNGQGTAANLQTSSFKFQVSNVQETSTVPLINEIKDIDPPEFFTPTLAQSPDVFNNLWFVVFSTQDKGTGIDHYEVAEKSGALIGNYNSLPWQRAVSPYLLIDQSLGSSIYIKAVDRAGNFEVAILPNKDTTSTWFNSIEFWSIILLLGIITIGIIKKIWRRLRQKNQI